MNARLTGWRDAIGAGPDLSRGLCVGDWLLFDNTDDPLAVEEAIGLCLECPVLTRCREWSAGLSPRELSGIVAAEVRPWQPRSSKPKAAAS